MKNSLQVSRNLSEEKLEALLAALEHLEIKADDFGNVTLEHKNSGSTIVFTNQGDIQLHAARDVDAKTGRWFHVNSSTETLEEQYGK
jgi:hypothetical protein